jgi:hypothetical protein
MAHVRRQPRQTRMEIDAVAVPARQSVNSEGMSNVVGSGALTTMPRLEPQSHEQASKSAPDGRHIAIRFTCRLYEERGARHGD